MLLRAFGLTACVLLAGCSSTQNTGSEPNKSEVRSPSTIISSASADVWQQVNNDDVLRIDLPTGRVYVQLNPQLAPGHVDNIKKLAREGFYRFPIQAKKGKHDLFMFYDNPSMADTDKSAD